MRFLNKIKSLLYMLAIGAFLMVSLNFTRRESRQLVCTGIEINVTDSSTNWFIRDDEILAKLNGLKKNIKGVPIREVNTLQIEQLLRSNAMAKTVEAYTTSDGKLNIDIRQRQPIVRVFDAWGRSYYIDREGVVVSTSANYTSHVLVASGHFEQLVRAGQQVADSAGILSQIYSVANFVATNSFWEAQIEQLYVRADGDIELIPRVGAHQIVLGDATDLQRKFSHLRVLYEKGFSYTGWNNYSVINLKYYNQIICTKK